MKKAPRLRGFEMICNFLEQRDFGGRLLWCQLHTVQNRQHQLQEEVQQQDLYRQHHHVFHNALGQIVEVAFAVKHTAPHSAQSHIDQHVDTQLRQSDPQQAHPAAIEEQRVQEGTGHGCDGVAKEEAVRGWEQDEAQNIRYKARQNSHDRTIDQRAHGVEQVTEVDVLTLGNRDVEVLEDQTQGDEQGGYGQHTGRFGISDRLLPVGRGKGSGE